MQGICILKSAINLGTQTKGNGSSFFDIFIFLLEFLNGCESIRCSGAFSEKSYYRTWCCCTVSCFRYSLLSLTHIWIIFNHRWKPLFARTRSIHFLTTKFRTSFLSCFPYLLFNTWTGVIFFKNNSFVFAFAFSWWSWNTRFWRSSTILSWYITPSLIFLGLDSF